MAELKPCPFCGSADVGVGIELPQFGQELKRFVVCNCCGSRTASYRKEDVAVGIWNNCTEPERPKGRWVLTAHEESCNYRWNVTAECSECSHSKGEVCTGLFPGFPKDLARDIILKYAESVKQDNFCPNCGADMRGESDGNG